MNPPTLLILRGKPGSGKTTVAALLSTIPGAVSVSADSFPGRYDMTPDGPTYVWEYATIGLDWCEKQVELFLRRRAPCVIVDNMNNSIEAVQRYQNLALTFNYRFMVLKVEGRYKSIHNVPDDFIQKAEEMYEPWTG